MCVCGGGGGGGERLDLDQSLNFTEYCVFLAGQGVNCLLFRGGGGGGAADKLLGDTTFI